MVSYRKRGNVWQYEISYKDIDGKYKKLRKSGFIRKADAVLAASQINTFYPTAHNAKNGQQLFSDFFEQWINLYKKNSVSRVTFIKYQNTLNHINRIFRGIKLNELTRSTYQIGLNKFGETHSLRTVSTFHKQIRAALLDALEEKRILIDPTRKAVITGKNMRPVKKSLDFDEWKRLIKSLDTTKTEDIIIYLALKTGMRFAEILGITLLDIDDVNHILTINKTWDYKFNSGFKPTKNTASNRKIIIDTQTINILQNLAKSYELLPEEPLFISNSHSIVSAEINKILTSKLTSIGIERVTFHALRHTHASILLFNGVNILTVSKRLGHSSVNTTQSTYLHIIKELELQDDIKILQLLTQK